jgi:beta-glucosidase
MAIVMLLAFRTEGRTADVSNTKKGLDVTAVGGDLYKTDPIERKIDELMAKMTLDEKIGQVTQQGAADSKEQNEEIRQGKVGSLLSHPGSAEEIRDYVNRVQHIAVEESRLHIPIIFGYDVIHGFRTTFPIPLGIGATFDPACAESMGRVAATEGRAAGIHWTFAPMIDVARDARWGRIAEGCGEDPYLTSKMGVAMVQGIQGKDLASPDSMAACAKHFVAYGAGEGGRDYETADMSISTLYNVYLPPYKAAVDAGVQTVMASFNEIGGVPMTCNKDMLTDLLKKKWGFDGFVVSDANAVHELTNHGVAGTREDAGRLALTAGLDMDMGSNCYHDYLKGLITSGRLDEAILNDAVRRILRVKFRLGLFEHPYTDVKLFAKVELSPEHIAAARKVAQESIVLLKNEKDLLPFSKSVKSIAVIGPLAGDQNSPLGTWAALGRGDHVVSILDGIKKAVSPDTVVRYVAGCTLPDRYFDTNRTAASRKTDEFQKAVDAVRQSDVAIVVVGEHNGMSGEAGSRADITLPGVQQELVEAVQAVGKPVVVILMNGRPLAVPWIADNIPAILEIWHPGIQAGVAAADVVFGDYNPGGKLPVTFPKETGFCPMYYNHKNAGRPAGSSNIFAVGYSDSEYKPVFPFGYGLSYTTFEYSNLKVDPSSTGIYGTIHVSAYVKNTGKRAGDEVVQLYIRDLVSSITRPVKELKGFQRISLKPGETKRVRFALGPREIEYFDNSGRPVIEPGEFKVWIGGSSISGVEGAFYLGENPSAGGNAKNSSTGYVGGWQSTN